MKIKAIIVGAGIGGLTSALMLHARGIEVTIFERSAGIRELGVGINILPQAIGILSELGLLPALDAVGVRTHELIYATKRGQTVWQELRGIEAGHPFPQISVHRGKLQGLLFAAVEERLPGNVLCGHTFENFTQDATGLTASFRSAHGEIVRHTADVLIAADGIHSAVRAKLYPEEGPPIWNGNMLWRGALPWPPFLSGKSMIIAGGMDTKAVLYPIAPEPHGRVLLNWAVMARVEKPGAAPPRREDWSRTGLLGDVLPHAAGFALNGIDLGAIIRATPEFYEYPLCDRDPVDRWSWDRVTLLGDAAHPMYPVGSNGASQAILDALVLAEHLATSPDPSSALRSYEMERSPATAKMVRGNRLGGPERAIDLVESRAPNGFERIDDVASREELRSIVGGRIPPEDHRREAAPAQGKPGAGPGEAGLDRAPTR